MTAKLANTYLDVTDNNSVVLRLDFDDGGSEELPLAAGQTVNDIIYELLALKTRLEFTTKPETLFVKCPHCKNSFPLAAGYMSRDNKETFCSRFCVKATDGSFGLFKDEPKSRKVVLESI